MADDIVTRLRSATRTCNHGFPNGAGDSFPDPTDCGGCLRLSDAADEIEQLRVEINSMASAQAGWGRVARLEAEIERLRTAGDALYAAVRNHDLTEAHLRGWEEARRG